MLPRGCVAFFITSEVGVNSTYEVFGEFLERFGWLRDSLVYRVEFHGNLRYELSVTISLRAQDQHEDRIDKTVKLILGGVTEFRLAQRINWATFETSSGVGLAVEGDRVFLDLGSLELAPADDPTTLRAPPRHRSVEHVRQNEFYFDCTDFIGEVLPLEAIIDDRFGDLKDDIIGISKGESRRRRDLRRD